MNSNQQNIRAAIAASDALDGNECQTIIADAINKGVNLGTMSPGQAIVIIEAIKFGILQKMCAPSIVRPSIHLPPDLNGGGRR